MDAQTEKIVKQVHMLLKERNVTLALAESCTGGLISHYLTMLPGASLFFVAGVVSYSAEMKIRILGVSPDVISSYGLISAQTAREMAAKIRTLTGANISLSTTGNLGPGVLEGKQKGLIYIACSRDGSTYVKELFLKGNRAENKDQATLSALDFLIECMEK